MSPKHHLLTPGPTSVPERLVQAMALPAPHHRSRTFKTLFAEIQNGLRWLFATEQDVLIHTSSGTGALEGAVVNLTGRNDEILYVNGGKFGERWGAIARAYGVVAHEIGVAWGKAIDPALVARGLRDHPGCSAVYLQAVESSTGVAHPVREIAALTRGTETLCVVDAVSALGAMPLPMDEWGIDVVLAASQKALMLPPGLAFAAVSKKAWDKNRRADLPRFYFDWARERESAHRQQTAWTPALSLLLGLAESLRLLQEETLPKVFARHERLARATRAAMQSLDLALLASHPAASLTAVVAPPGIDAEELLQRLEDQQGVILAGGQGSFKGKIFRLAHLGYFDDLDVVAAVAAVERGLVDMGYRKFPLGTAAGAAMTALAER